MGVTWKLTLTLTLTSLWQTWRLDADVDVAYRLTQLRADTVFRRVCGKRADVKPDADMHIADGRRGRKL